MYPMVYFRVFSFIHSVTTTIVDPPPHKSAITRVYCIYIFITFLTTFSRMSSRHGASLTTRTTLPYDPCIRLNICGARSSKYNVSSLIIIIIIRFHSNVYLFARLLNSPNANYKVITRKGGNKTHKIFIQFNSVLYYLYAESTATRPITETAQYIY
jgi:hypothetical protein